MSKNYGISKKEEKLYIELTKNLDIINGDGIAHIGNEDEKCKYVSIIVKNNNNSKNDYDYSVIVSSKKSYMTQLVSQKIVYPKMKLLIKINCSTRPFIVWNNFKEKLSNKLIISNYDFNLRKNYTERDLIVDVIDMIQSEKSKYNYDSDNDF